MTLHTVAAEIDRDSKGRPMVRPISADGTVGFGVVSYVRCTTFVGCLEDRYALEKWQQRMVLIGISENPDLVLSAFAHRDDKSTLNSIADQAQNAAKARVPATIGTAVHKIAADMDRGYDLGNIPGDWQRDLDAYARATAQMHHLHVEQFMVQDELCIGGTPDRICELDGRNYIADIKTGDIDRPGKIAMQLSVYAQSRLYDIVTGQRTTIEVDLSNAIIIHLPAGTGTCQLYWCNIAAGWEAVKLAAAVRKWRSGQAKLVAPFPA